MLLVGQYFEYMWCSTMVTTMNHPSIIEKTGAISNLSIEVKKSIYPERGRGGGRTKDRFIECDNSCTPSTTISNNKTMGKEVTINLGRIQSDCVSNPVNEKSVFYVESQLDLLGEVESQKPLSSPLIENTGKTSLQICECYSRK